MFKRLKKLDNDIQSRFKRAGKGAKHFIDWAADKGVDFHPGEVSDHISGKRTITKGLFLAYEWFLSEIESPEVPKEVKDWIKKMPEALK